jgi:hypothetical protein
MAGANKRFERKQGWVAPFELLCYIWSLVLASTVVLKCPAYLKTQNR